MPRLPSLTLQGMRLLRLTPLFAIITFTALWGHAGDIRKTCTPTSSTEPPLTRGYRLLQSYDDIAQEAQNTYSSDRRLKGRAYWDSNMNTLVLPYGRTTVKLPPKFTDGLGTHLTKSLQNRYVDGIIYSDMGHVHLLLPSDEWKKIKDENSLQAARLEKALTSPNLKALYHTAEMVQLKEGDFAKGSFPQDAWKLWRYFSRNLLASFDEESPLEVIWAGAKPIYNTVRTIPEMTEFSTLYFSANHNGCIPFSSAEGISFFDLTADSIPYEMN